MKKVEMKKRSNSELKSMSIDKLFDEYAEVSIELNNTKHDDPNFRRCMYYQYDIKYAIKSNYKEELKIKVMKNFL